MPKFDKSSNNRRNTGKEDIPESSDDRLPPSKQTNRSNPPPKRNPQNHASDVGKISAAARQGKTAAVPGGKYAQLQREATPTPTRDEAPFKDAIFSPDGMHTWQQAQRLRFSSHYGGYLPVIHQTYNRLCAMDKDFASTVPSPLFQYYCVSLLWIRFLSIRGHNFQGTQTFEEFQILETAQHHSLCYPKPIDLYLRAIGLVTSPTGESLLPDLPSLPGTVNHPGCFGPLNDETINLYAEVPTLFVSAEACRQMVAHPHGGQYVSQLGAINANCLGYYPNLPPLKPGQAATFQTLGITEDAFPESWPSSCLSFAPLSYVSTKLIQAATKRVPVSDSPITELPPTGSVAQIVDVRPTPHIGVRCDASIATASTLAKTPDIDVAVAYVFAYSRYNEPDNAGDQLAWAPFDPTPAMIENRNARRNTIPARYHDQVFLGSVRNRFVAIEGAIQRLIPP